jgi:3'(2'), 5'-bisphosphate nucleotidase
MNIDITKIIEIAKHAGDEILKIYGTADFGVEQKSDDSPLTLADQASHDIIYNQLKDNYPDIPVLSEEGKDIPYDDRKDWKYFWLVDPLDGTKEFIKRNGEFTVNIALIENNQPVLGVILAPVLDTTYYGKKGEGAFKIEKGEKSKLKVNYNNNGLTAVKSRSHSSDDEENLLSQYNIQDTISIGSSLKFCMVAEGKADIYYRHGPTWEWDTAAGQAIVEAAGGKVEGLSYNKEIIKNSSFLVKGFL